MQHQEVAKLFARRTIVLARFPRFQIRREKRKIQSNTQINAMKLSKIFLLGVIAEQRKAHRIFSITTWFEFPTRQLL